MVTLKNFHFGLSPARVVAGVLVAIVVSMWLVTGGYSTPQGEPATYVGQATCLQSGCHDGPYKDRGKYSGATDYLKTFHQRSHRIPDSNSVLIHRYFDGDSILSFPIALSGVQDILRIHFSSTKGPDRYRFNLSLESGDLLSTMVLSYAMGGNSHIQRYMVELEGSQYVLPLQYVLPVYNQKNDTGTTILPVELEKWLTVDSSGQKPVLRFLKWTTNRFRAQSWDRTCAPCHATVSDIGFSSSGQDSAWHSHVVNSDVAGAMSVDCESCHGPGSTHAANPTASNIVSPVRFGTTPEGTDLKLDLCMQCHSRVQSTEGHYEFPYDEKNSQAYLPGTPIESYLAGGDRQNSALRWPDSSEQGHHQTGQDFLLAYGYSKHVYKDGCWSCHTVHSSENGLPFQLNQNWYSLRDGEGCVSCHGSMGSLFQKPLEDFSRTEVVNGYRVNVHTRHSPQVSQCVNCHFSKTASLSLVDLPTKPYYEFTSHHFRVIRPNLTRQYRNDANGVGQINTCAEACHRNGRGSRNFRPTDPIAPNFGITDPTLTRWNEQSDVALADTLWQHYQNMFLPALSAERIAGPEASNSGLESVFPNPVRNHCTIHFSVAERSRVSLEVATITGTTERVIATGLHERGEYSAEWDGTDDLGRPVPAGVYVLRLMIGKTVYSTKLQVIP